MDINKADIRTEQDVELMVDSFYAKVNQDPLLSYVFNDFAEVDWQSHLPKMYQFWSTLIFGVQSYKGNPFAAHVPLPVDKTHFERWLCLFEENMDELFAGEVAEHTKLRAKSIAYVFSSKLAQIKNHLLKID